MEKKLRYSHQREMIYRHLLQAHEHPTAEMIHEALRKTIPDLSLGTVYRNLRLLEELGKIRRITVHQGSERYDAICSDHVHFICSGCGSICDVEGVDAKALCEKIPLDARYEVSKLDLTITGVCPQCAQ